MTSLLNATWFHWLVAAVLVAMLLVLVFGAWWALFADRPRGRRRCPRCWHDLTHTPGMRCGECGHAARHERELGRTRRRWSLAVLAIAGCVAINLYAIDRASTFGWLRWAPTRALLWTLPVADDPAGLLRREIDLRIRGDELTDEQWLALARRCVDGDAGARPADDAWIAKYAPIVATLRQRSAQTSRDAGWRSAVTGLLLTIPPRIELDARTSWPAGIAPTLDAIARDWWPDGVHARVTVTPRLPGAEATVSVRRDDPIQRVSFSVGLPPLPEGEHDVVFDLAFAQRPDGDADWQRVAESTVTVPVRVEGTLPDVLEAVTSPDHDDRMRRVFRRGLAKWSSGSLPVRVRIDPRPTLDAFFDDTAVGVRIDVLRNGRLARRLDAWWRAGTDTASARTSWEVPFWRDELLGAPDRPDDVWTVHVRGLPELALRVRGASRYWAGEVTVDVPVQSLRGTAPPRGWIAAEDVEESKRRKVETGSPGAETAGSSGEDR